MASFVRREKKTPIESATNNYCDKKGLNHFYLLSQQAPMHELVLPMQIPEHAHVAHS